MRGIALVCLFLTASSPPAAGGDEAAASLQAVPESHCVVLPEELVDPAVTAEWNGRTVAFCCKMCRKQFLADPEAFAARLPALPAALDAAPAPATDARPAEAPGDVNRPASWRAWLGRLHPLLVHFPIALLVLAGASEILVRPGDARWRARARFLLSLGAPLAVVSAALGWLAALESGYPTLSNVLLRHRWLGIGTALCALLALALAPREHTPGLRRERAYRWVLLVTVVLVTLAGHHGATLVFGPGWLSLPR